MNTDKIRAALVKRFRDEWPAGAPTPSGEPELALAQIGMPGKKFTRPNNELYGKLSLQFGDREAVAVGAKRVRIVGMLYLQVFVPEDGGDGPAGRTADHFASKFDNESVAFIDGSGWIICAHVSPMGAAERPGYQQHTYSVSFYSDELN